MSLLQIAALAVVQGMAELLPVSSSAHVVVAEKLMGLDPSSPEMTFLLVMLHTGTTFAVILYFWPRWRERFLNVGAAARAELLQVLVVATLATGGVGLLLKRVIEKVVLGGGAGAEVESLFSNLLLIGAALAAAGALILWAGSRRDDAAARPLTVGSSFKIGLVQGLCLPFRGFSRSGATISTALLLGIARELAEDFSFALAVILTPPVLAIEGHRLVKAAHAAGRPAWSPELFKPGLIGMVFSFAAGLLALRWLSSWLEKGRWSWFGWYCLAASAGVLVFALR